MQRISVKQALSGQVQPGTEVEVCGWVRTRRDSKAGISFINVHDGSCQDPLQVVAPSTLSNYASEVQHLTAGASVIAHGTLVQSQGKGQSLEVQAVEVFMMRPLRPKNRPMLTAAVWPIMRM